MDINFVNKVAVITGAGSGLGKSYAIELSRRGAKVVVNDISMLKDRSGKKYYSADIVAQKIKSAGGEAIANYDSVTEEKSADNIVQSALNKYSKIDILINNAGINYDISFRKMTEKDFDSVIKVNLYGSFNVTRAVFPSMIENCYGRIVMTTSIAGLYGNYGQVNYGSAKLGLVGFMNSLKEEGLRHNIYVNTISPLASTSSVMDSVFPETISSMINPESVTAMVMYLCSDQCKTTGHIVGACGGYYTRTRIVENQGCYLGDSSRTTPELIALKYNLISENKGIKSYTNTINYLSNVCRVLLTKNKP